MNFNFFNPLFLIKRFNVWLDRQNWLIQSITMLFIVFFIRTFVFGLYSVPTGSMEPTMLVGEGFFADKLSYNFCKIKRGDIISFNTPVFDYSDNRLVYLFQRYVWGPENWTKRVIGLPGERIVGRIENGVPVIYINGEKFHEDYINQNPLITVREKSYQMILSFPFFKEQNNIRHRTYVQDFDIFSDKQPYYKISPKDIFPNIENPIIYYPNIPYYDDNSFDVFDVTLKDDEYWGMGDNRQGSFDSRGFGPIKRELIHGRIVYRIFSLDTVNSLLYEVFANPIEFFTKKFRSWNRWFNKMK